MHAFIERVLQERCLKCCSSMTTLGCTQVCCTKEANNKFWKDSVAAFTLHHLINHLPHPAKTLSGHHYATDTAVQNAMHMWPQRKDSNFYQEGIHVLVLKVEESH